MTCSIDCHLKGRGWAEFSIRVDDATVVLTASYLHDSLDELVRAVRSIVDGALEARVLFEEEPGEYRLVIERIGEDQVRLRALVFERTFSRSTDENGRTVFSAECGTWEFASALLSTVQRLLQDHGADGYRELWNYAFPSDAVSKLEKSLHSSNIIDAALVSKLTAWAASKPTISALHVFGSYAKGRATPTSDLDLAFDFTERVDSALAELMWNAAAWKAELQRLTGIRVKDLRLRTDRVVGAHPVTVFRRDAAKF